MFREEEAVPLGGFRDDDDVVEEGDAEPLKGLEDEEGSGGFFR